MISLCNYFDGKFQEAPLSGRDSSDQTLERFSPYDLSQKIWTYPVCYAHIEKVIHSAEEGYQQWKKTSLGDRLKLFENFIGTLGQKKEELAKTLSLENGQPLSNNLNEIELVLKQAPGLLHFYSQKLKASSDRNLRSRGPALFISSFCRPIFFAQRFLINNLLAGNSVIIKPSEKTSLSIQQLVECLALSGFPKGTINLIHGDAQGETARRLFHDKKIKVFFFTGSHEVAHTLTSDASALISSTNKNICLIDKDIDQEQVIKKLLISAYQLSGQDCFGTSVAFIHEEIKENFIDKFHEETKKLVIDQPFAQDLSSFMGPLIDQQAMDNYILYMGMAKREGFQEIMRGKQLEKKSKGHFVTPSIHFADSFIEKSRFLQSDVLGPNITFISYKNIEEAISMANRIDFSSHASLFSTNASHLRLCQENLNASTLCLNKTTSDVIEHNEITTSALEVCLRPMDIFN